MSVVYKINGQEVPREKFTKKLAKNVGVPMASQNTYRGYKPLISESAGVMKSQVAETRELIKKANIQGVKVRDNGSLEITSRRGRKEFIRLRGKADYDGGYGDG